MQNPLIDNTDPVGGAARSIECGTCVATGTTACADCVVTHLLANDDGPIDLVTVAPRQSSTDRAIALFANAGMLDQPVGFVASTDFEHPSMYRRAHGGSEPLRPRSAYP